MLKPDYRHLDFSLDEITPFESWLWQAEAIWLDFLELLYVRCPTCGKFEFVLWFRVNEPCGCIPF